MSVLLDGINQYLVMAAPKVAPPFSISFWFKAADVSQGSSNAVLVSVDDGSNDQCQGQLRGDQANYPVAVAARNSAWAVAYSVAPFPQDDTWHHVLVVFAETQVTPVTIRSSRTVYLDGASKASNTDSQNATGLTAFSLGCRFGFGTPGVFFEGQLGYVTFYDDALADADAAYLAAGNDPEGVGTVLTYHKLVSDPSEANGGTPFTPYNSPTYSSTDNPPVGSEEEEEEEESFHVLSVRPNAPIREHLLFNTGILRRIGGDEQRIANRNCPRIQLDLTYSGESRKRLELFLFSGHQKLVGMPAWYEPSFASSAIAVGDTVLNVDSTDYGNFFAGGYAIVYQDEIVYDAILIDSVTSTSITLASGVTNSYASGVQIMPLMLGHISPETTMQKHPVNEQTFSIRFTARASDNDIADDSAWGTFEGKVLLDGPNLISGMLDESMTTEVITLDNVTGDPQITSLWPYAIRGSNKGFKTVSRESLWNLRCLLYFLRGPQTSFYMPTFFKDLIPNQDLTSSSTLFIMDNVGYTVHAAQVGPKEHIRVVLKDGTVLSRDVTDSVQVSATVEQLTVDTAWPYDIEVDDIERCDFVELIRFATDDIVIEHINALGWSKCTVATVGVIE